MTNSPPETRASLILRLENASDMVAWEEFAELYGPVVFRVARRRGLQSADADNLVQEVLFAVAQSISKWIQRTDRGSFHAWLLRIAHNEALDLLSSRATRALGLDGDAGQRELDDLAVRNDISALVEREYQHELFRLAAERVQQMVSDRTWRAFWLTEVDGKTVQQAAVTLGTSMGHIYVSRSRVMARIREFVQKYEARQ